MADGKPIYEVRFNAAVKVIQSLPPNGSFQPSNDMMLKFYSYYKQATQGPCSIPRPGFWDPVGKAKWDAWSSLGSMAKEDAMVAYVEEMKLILESMPMTDEVEQLLRVLGPFYEVVEDKKKITQVGDLPTARLEKFARSLEGFGSMLSSATPKRVTKSIVYNLTMNGTLENNNKVFESIKVEAEEDDRSWKEEKGVLAVKVNGSVERPPMFLPNGCVEQASTSLSNGMASSKSALNGKEKTEEPVSPDSPTELRDVNGHISDYSEDVSSVHHVASDSDSEVYCDSMDQFGLEETSEVAFSHPQQASDAPSEALEIGLQIGNPVGGSEGVQCGGEECLPSGSGHNREKLSRCRTDSSALRRGRGAGLPDAPGGNQGGLLGHGGDGEGWGSEGGAQRADLNKQIVTALTRLQEDMQSVLQRLHTLEALTASQAHSLPLHPNYPAAPAKKRRSWWPFDISPGTVAFAVIWPFVVQWLVCLYLQRRRRRIN